MILDFRFKKDKIKENKDSGLFSTNFSAGFTLIESLIYIAIMGLVVTSFISFSLSVSDANNKNYVAQEVQANTRIALNIISQKILQADSINIGSSVFGSDPGILSLAMADGSKNPTIINLNQNNGQLQITEGLSSPVLITTDEIKVTNLVFTDLTGTSDKSSIKIEMTVEYNNPGSDIKYDYTQTVQTAVSLRQ